MRPVHFFISTSADGLIARENGCMDWLKAEHDFGFDAFYERVDCLLMGRKTFEQTLSQGPWPYAGKTTYVFSKSLKTKFGPDVKIVDRDAATFVEELKDEEGQKIWLVGGADLARSLMNEKLVDEIILNIHSEMLGKGIELFPLPLHSMFWELVESRELPSGVIQVRYRLKSTEKTFD